MNSGKIKSSSIPHTLTPTLTLSLRVTLVRLRPLLVEMWATLAMRELAACFSGDVAVAGRRTMSSLSLSLRLTIRPYLQVNMCREAWGTVSLIIPLHSTFSPLSPRGKAALTST